jgi:isocitrate dehydrogenase (NAD+)
MQTTNERRKVTLIKGDGIGPEIADAVTEILDAAGAPVVWEEAEAGLACVEKYGNGLPPETLESVRRNRVALKGPTTTPAGGGHKSVNVTIRKTLDLFANVRPARTLPGVETRFPGVNLMLVRENIEDTYGGIEHWQTPDVTQCLKVVTRPGSLAVIRYAFEMARSMKRRRVTCVHKANIHKITDGLFLDCFRDVAEDYPDLQSDDVLIDNACMQLVTRPEQYDVMVLPNLYGDIVSDLCAGLVGGLGVAPGGNIGLDRAVFESVHGSAPDIAGKGLANPTALLLSASLMLYYIGQARCADRVERALEAALASGAKTRDLGGRATTKEFVRAVVGALPTDEGADDEHAFAPTRTPFYHHEAPAEREPWTPHGVDLFIHHAGLPSPPEQVGRLRLSLISNRGTKVYPGPPPDIFMVEWFRLRYKSDGPVTDAELIEFLSKMSERFEWVHVEKLHEVGGEAMYSKAQGE